MIKDQRSKSCDYNKTLKLNEKTAILPMDDNISTLLAHATVHTQLWDTKTTRK